MSEYSLPSNKKFGIFFFWNFFYFISVLLFNGNSYWYITKFICSILLIITFVKADILMLFNKLWMNLVYLVKLSVRLFLGLFFTLFQI